MRAYPLEIVKEIYNEEVADSIRIQYGGSVKPENIEELLAMADIDGALVGGASLGTRFILEIVRGRSK